MHQRNEPADLSESSANQVLARAAQLDALSGHTVSVADLRAAAREAGISEASIDRALSEIDAPAADAPAQTPRHAWWSGRTKRALLGAAGIIALLAVFATLRERVVPREFPIEQRPVSEQPLPEYTPPPAPAPTPAPAPAPAPR